MGDALTLYNRTIKRPWVTSGLDVQYKLVGNELSFQCTVSKSDWRHNFMIQPYRNTKTKWYAHKGFVLLYKSVRDEILELVKDIPLVHVCGYSQGAAIATLALEDIRFSSGKAVEGSVFGSPRVLWLPPKEIRSRFTSLVNWQVRGDIATKAPFAWLGYRHVGSVKKLGPCSILSATKHEPASYRKYLE